MHFFLPNISNKSRAVFQAWTIYSMHRIIVSSKAPTLHFLYNRVGQKLLFFESIQNYYILQVLLLQVPWYGFPIAGFKFSIRPT